MKASDEGKRKIKVALEKKKLKPLAKETLQKVTLELHISETTWKAFVYAERLLGNETFKRCCELLDLNWVEIVDSLQTSKYNWNSAPSPEPNFYGRDRELAILKQSVLSDRYRWVILYGFGGIGKTQLAVKLGAQVQNQFDRLIWQKLSYTTPKDKLLTDLLERLSLDNAQITSNLVEGFLEELKRQRILIILDEQDLYEEGKHTDGNRDSYKDYCNFLHQLSLERHESCIVLTSRERPENIGAAASLIKAYEIKELDVDAGCNILKYIELPKDLTFNEQTGSELVQRYGGNPLALKLVAFLIHDSFDGNVREFLNKHERSLVVPDGIEIILKSLTKTLSKFEKNILQYIAKASDSVSLDELYENLPTEMYYSDLSKVLQTLKGRSLIIGDSEGNEVFCTLQPMVRKFVQRQLT
ncbi:hypothetical protein BV372_16905 [Nostoc sp. T09]|uniref:NB-ARC domain-containing protein n=1 Tax=Nostoc sp. T09 TaxID=1932621 RepID=UPI000B6431D6|nr:NB-ARC domain-containing protein [Nostoc sp. T09]OUL33367.1 hypothetical protein BV372_16905 [Nostoc sp. T09]